MVGMSQVPTVEVIWWMLMLPAEIEVCSHVTTVNVSASTDLLIPILLRCICHTSMYDTDLWIDVKATRTVHVLNHVPRTSPG